jgi:hypothetical protein
LVVVDGKVLLGPVSKGPQPGVHITYRLRKGKADNMRAFRFVNALGCIKHTLKAECLKNGRWQLAESVPDLDSFPLRVGQKNMSFASAARRQRRYATGTALKPQPEREKSLHSKKKLFSDPNPPARRPSPAC